MGSIIGPVKVDLQKLDKQLDEFIDEVGQGKGDIGKLFSITQQLSALMKNPQVPLSVKEHLQGALKDLQSEKVSENLDMGSLTAAKVQIDKALQEK
ncbi:MAG: hypothetical protein K940chlam9_00617 [Chlamydiae bacterium]|nr:hypothetical protein [Chlamydiota bacterium]